jgi:MFS family permease
MAQSDLMMDGSRSEEEAASGIETEPLTHPHHTHSHLHDASGTASTAAAGPATSTATGTAARSSALSQGLKRVALVFSGPLRLTTLRLTVVWFTLCFGTYGLNTWISTIFRDIGIKNEFLPTFLFALANGPGNLASFYLIERLGRKKLLAYAMLLAALSSFLFALTSAHLPWLAVAAACMFQAFSVAGWNSLDALSTESFPTAARTTGMGLLSGTGRLASLVAMIVNGSLEHSVALLFAVTGSFTILGALTAFCLPYEPTGRSLDGGSVGEGGRGSRYAGFKGGREREQEEGLGRTEEMT